MFAINGVVWQVYEVSANHPMLRRSDGSRTIGACVNNTKSIYIVEGLNQRKFKKVLCHEIVHAAFFSYDVRLSIEQEELIADLIATYGEEIIIITNKIFGKIKRGDTLN